LRGLHKGRTVPAPASVGQEFLGQAIEGFNLVGPQETDGRAGGARVIKDGAFSHRGLPLRRLQAGEL
jgi:hypothetical protein